MMSRVVASRGEDNMLPGIGSCVLFLGHNGESTDLAVTTLADQHGVQNHGLITDSKCAEAIAGFYHTTMTDIAIGDLITLASRFDTIVMLDQPQSEWSHWKCLQATCKLMLQLEALGMRTVFRDNHNTRQILYWIDLVYKKNPSMCIYPWINLNNDGARTKLCARDQGTVTNITEIKDWGTDSAYQRIRSAMLAGEKLPEHCQVCYDYEAQGMESYRQFETIDWVTQLELENTDSLVDLKHPLFYEISTGNQCNIMCRGCQPAYSAPIAREQKKFNISAPVRLAEKPHHYHMEYIDIDSLESTSSVYFQGGEPTIMPEVREFMRQCIKKKRTDFFLTMCTNGVKISQEFLDLLAYFSNTNFSFSIDGYDRVNDYWRWGSTWSKVIDNAHKMQALGHFVSINTVPGIYNVTNMHLLFDFLDREFPHTAVYMQVNYLPWQSAYNHPLADLVIDSMKKCQQTIVYQCNGKSCKTSIDSILHHYASGAVCDTAALKDFFAYNDQLDRARQSRLEDYIPELELARQYIT